MNIRHHRLTATLLTLGVLVGTTAGCVAMNPTAAPSASRTAATQASAITVSDAWVKTADSGMTAGFGTFSNDSEEDVNIVGVKTPAAAMSELHETVEDETGTMVMRRIEGGFVLPAGSDFLLEPAANHLMMMDLSDALHAGDEVPFTLEFADGSSLEFTAVVKDYAGANENYVGGDMGGDE